MAETEAPPAPPATAKASRDLVDRVVWGALLAALAVTFDYLGHLPFSVLVGLIAVLMSWEWGRLVRAIEIDAAHVLHAAAVAIAVLLAALGYPALGLVALVAGAIAVLSLRFGEDAVLSALGVLYVGIPAIALLWLRGDEAYGFLAILLVFIVVWSTDTAAYATGRTLGGPKLWRAISPNKTWSGLVGGVLAAGIAAALFAQFVDGASAVRLGLVGMAMGAVSQAGDLAESALKRRCGAKDASHIIPGHGGVMDRMDGLVAAATLAALVGLALNVHAPARSLLLWQ